ncbi:AfsR/SARP family transcriptional regulator [Streptomyces sp. NBC_00328]|uniref:AfsR/SARP family transcriptional regulator n=1 Tax=Streptomyces sp. NBC_00328 TaxID=2903646 RepID=UPI002E27C739|nr:BTAD domain-containing putative transcriptional regulator [Streptomyces sp. NBC_00328]
MAGLDSARGEGPVDAGTAGERGVRVGVLGPLVVRRDGVVVDPGRRRQRLLLIRLLLADGHAVASETLCEDLWQGQPPASATPSLHAHVSKLRAVLEQRRRGPGRFETLVSEPTGYALRVPPEGRDTVRFTEAVARARQELAASRVADALRTVERALGMWRGAALADAADHPFARPEADRLEDMRQSAAELHATALLLDGQVPRAVAAAEQLTTRHPLRETGWALLLRALYLAGRHPEALRRYEDVRRHLADELGLDLGPELRALHHGILGHDLPALTLPRPVAGAPTAPPSGRPVPSAGDDAFPPSAPLTTGSADRAVPAGVPDPRGGPPHRPRPAQLPNDLAVFAGRETESAWMGTAGRVLDRPGPDAARVVVIGGAAGVGKTTFVVHHAHQVAHLFPDGQLFVNLCGFHPRTPALDPALVLHGFLIALGVPAQRIPEDTAARTALFRSTLAARRVLVVLDNARDEEQVRPLLPNGSGCLTLVTSRNRLAGLVAGDGAHPLPLALPSETEAHEMLARRLGPERLDAEPDATAGIVRLCGRLPLALAVIAARAALDPAFPLSAVADDLSETGGRLDSLTTFDADTDLRAVFSWSYRALDQPSARLFRLLALHPGPDITAPAVASLAALPLPRARRLLAELAQLRLVEQPVPGRYTLHDLLREYATELTHDEDAHAERHDATARVLDHYVFTGHAGNRLLNHEPKPVAPGPLSPGAVPEQLGDLEQVARWFTAEQQVLDRLFRTAVAQRLDHHVITLARILKEYLNRHERWPEAVAVLTAALDAARRRGDRHEQGRCLRMLGVIHGQMGRQDEAMTHLDRAAPLFESSGDAEALVEAVRTQYTASYVLGLFGRDEEALARAERALELARETGDPLWMSDPLNAVARYHTLLGRPEQGITYGLEAISVFQGLNAPWREAMCWDCLGRAYHAVGRHREALASHRRALAVFEEGRDRKHAIRSSTYIGDTHLAMGDREAARAAWTRALEDTDGPEEDTFEGLKGLRARLAALDAEPTGAVRV